MLHKSAVDFALKHHISLGRYGEGHGAKEGHYYVAGCCALSFKPTAQSALAMMRRYLRETTCTQLAG